MSSPITLAKSANQTPVSTGRVLPDLAAENAMLMERLAALEAKLSSSASGPRPITLKVSDKGALCVYGLGRFPVTLYAGQWRRLLAEAETIKAFLKANASSLTEKPTHD